MAAETGTSPSGPTIAQTFKDKLQIWRTKAYCGREYIPAERVRHWLATKEDGHVQTNFVRLLDAAWTGSSSWWKLDSQELSPYILVFAILVAHDYGHHINGFFNNEIADSQLGSDLTRKYESLHTWLGDDSKQVIETFDKSRWMFCPGRLDLHRHTAFHSEHQILPFYKRDRLGSGGCAEVWAVSVKQEMIPPRMRDRMKDSLVTSPEHGPIYNLAIKCYSGDDHALFNWEKDAYDLLRGQVGMVQCFGSYDIIEFDPRFRTGSKPKNYVLVLELGELDLEEYLALPDQIPPNLPKEMLSFWAELFKVAEALGRIHHARHHNNDTSEDVIGWHFDVKPNNILRVNGEFKLADFGFSKFQKAEKSENNGLTPSEYMAGGTATFGAPECEPVRQRQGFQTEVTQTIDTWSYGCVLSEAATWIVLGPKGLRQYREFRMGVIRDLPTRVAHRKSDEDNRKDNKIPKADDSFHDGEKVLPEIRLWHNYLRSISRRTDTITNHVLTLVEDHLLLEDPLMRYTARKLSEQLKVIEEKGRLDFIEIPLELERRLANIEQTARQRTTDSNQTVISDDSSRENDVTTYQDTIASLRVPSAKRYRKSQRIGKSEKLERNPLSTTAHRTPGKLPAPTLPTLPEVGLGESSLTNSLHLTTTEHLTGAGTENNDHLLPSPLNIRPKTPIRQAGDAESPGTSHFDARQSQTTQSHSPGAITPPQGRRPEEPIDHNPYQKHGPTKLYTDIPAVVVATPRDASSARKQAPEPATSQFGVDYSIAGPAITASPTSALAELDAPGAGPFSKEKELSSRPTIPAEKRQFKAEIQISPQMSTAEMKQLEPPLDITVVRQKLEDEEPGKLDKWLLNSPRNKNLSRFISDRDIVFLVDNCSTMNKWWHFVSYTLETLAMNLGGLDKDGLDLLFTIGNESFKLLKKKKNAPAKFMKQMETARPTNDTDATDMAGSLGTIFDEYINSSQEKQKTLLVLTDGLWRGSADDDAVEKALIKFIRRTKDFKNERQKKRRFSIEFIYFGNDAGAIKRLQDLDDEIKNKHKLPDIVDHEPWTGNVEKMITGSFVESKDVQRTDTLSLPPPNRTNSNSPSTTSPTSTVRSSRISMTSVSSFLKGKGKSIDTK